MFKFDGDAKSNTFIEKDDLFKLINFQDIENTINSFTLQYVFNNESKHIKKNKDFPELYVFRIILNSPQVPSQLLESLFAYIKIPTVYILKWRACIRYIVPIKVNNTRRTILKRVLCTGWMYSKGDNLFEIKPAGNSVYDIYKNVISRITTQKFKNNEGLDTYIDRLIKLNTDSRPEEKYDQETGRFVIHKCFTGYSSPKSIPNSYWLCTHRLKDGYNGKYSVDSKDIKTFKKRMSNIASHFLQDDFEFKKSVVVYNYQFDIVYTEYVSIKKPQQDTDSIDLIDLQEYMKMVNKQKTHFIKNENSNNYLKNHIVVPTTPRKRRNNENIHRLTEEEKAKIIHKSKDPYLDYIMKQNTKK